MKRVDIRAILADPARRERLENIFERGIKSIPRDGTRIVPAWTAREAFEAMSPLIAPLLEAEYERRDLCILATRVAIEAARYFGIEAEAVPVQLIAYNQPFAEYVATGFAGVDESDPTTWTNGAWSVGVRLSEAKKEGRWNGHLIAVAGDTFGDFSIQQAERPERNIITGPALVGPYQPPMWRAINGDTGTVVEYLRLTTNEWRNAPDWKDEKRRRPLVGKLIRALRAMEVSV